MRRETRRILLAAAKAEFAERGYGAATVARIAERADVAIQTLYSAWGSKQALLRAIMETSVTGDDQTTGLSPDGVVGPIMANLPAGIDTRQRLTYLAHEFRLLAERSAIAWQTYRDAAAVDPKAAQDWQQFMAIRRRTCDQIVASVPKEDLSPGLTAEMAADTVWVIASPDTQGQLIRGLGYTYDQLEDWIGTILIAALLR